MDDNMAQKLISLVNRIGADRNDSDEARLKKVLLVCSAFMLIPAGATWGVVYLALGERAAGVIGLGYAVVSPLSIVLFALTRRYRLFLFIQLALILLAPWLFMIALGGFINSSAVVLWSMVCPLGALLFDEPRYTPRWFLAFLAIILLSGFLEPHLQNADPLSPKLITVFFVMNVGGVSSIVFILLYYFVSQKNLFQERSEKLLLNILPKEIADALRSEDSTIADYYAGASILFADVVNFTPLSAQMAPVDVVGLLNEVFSYFDTLVEKYRLEKIKTIGDCYMVAAGVPRPRPDHAYALAQMALDIQAYVSGREFRGKQLTFRIGINSGPVVAGVIGQKKFIYDLWGDAVNTASRMESHGVGGKIQITRATYELVKNDFFCEPCGAIEVKGKGEMEVWHVLGKRRESLSPREVAAAAAAPARYDVGQVSVAPG